MLLKSSFLGYMAYVAVQLPKISPHETMKVRACSLLGNIKP